MEKKDVAYIYTAEYCSDIKQRIRSNIDGPREIYHTLSETVWIVKDKYQMVSLI